MSWSTLVPVIPVSGVAGMSDDVACGVFKFKSKGQVKSQYKGGSRSGRQGSVKGQLCIPAPSPRTGKGQPIETVSMKRFIRDGKKKKYEQFGVIRLDNPTCTTLSVDDVMSEITHDQSFLS